LIVGDLTKNFNRKEFDCPCCGLNKTSPLLAEYVQIIRSSIAVPVRIVSGTRCPAHNAEVGGVPDSAHLEGLAADIQAQGYSGRALGELIKTLWKRGRLPELQYCYLIKNSNSVHIDVDLSKKNQRWRVFAF